MAPYKCLVLCAAIACCAVAARAQGTFQNLGFESATLVPIFGNSSSPVQFAPAFPGWTGSIGGVQVSAALYNNFFLDTSGIGIMDSGGPFLGGVIQGTYTAMLQAGLASGPDGMLQPADTTLSQTGLVPAAARSLLFRADLDGSSAAFVVTLGGQALSLFPLGGGTNYTLYGADIQALAGQTAELDFTVFAQRPHMDNYVVFLDSIQFSGIAIPEPSVLGLSTLGALFLSWRLCQKRR